MNPLEDSPRARKIAYQVFWVVSLIVGCIQIGFAAAKADTPTWLTVVLSVLPFVSSAIGYTAQANVKEPYTPEHAVNEKGYSPVEWLLVVLVVLIILIVLLKLLGLL